MPFGRLAKTAITTLAIAALAAPVEARPGGGKSSGSRGSSTFSAPPSTATAPMGAQPMQRTQTPQVGSPQRPGAPATAPAAPSRGLGFGGGLMAGLLGAGLIGALMGNGLFGGLSGIASMLGLLLQVGLVVGLVMLAIRFFRRRSEPALAGAGPGQSYARSAPPPDLGGARPAGPMGGMMGGGAKGGGAPARQPIQIVQEDYQAFERALTDIQLAYGREDIGRLRLLATPEMVGYLEDDLAADRAQGLRNEVADPKLLQGDLAEAWREGQTDYATVAMRFSLTDVMVERATGKVVSRNPSEATELWTFRRDPGRGWILSAIQQTA